MKDRCRCRSAVVEDWDSVESREEDVFHRVIGDRSGPQRPCRRGLDALVTVALAQPRDSQARAIALLGNRFVDDDALAQDRGHWPNVASPLLNLLGRLRSLSLVTWRHVFHEGGEAASLQAASVDRDSLAIVERLDEGLGKAQLDRLMDQAIRDGVVVAAELDVVVEVDAHLGERGRAGKSTVP